MKEINWASIRVTERNHGLIKSYRKQNSSINGSIIEVEITRLESKIDRHSAEMTMAMSDCLSQIEYPGITVTFQASKLHGGVSSPCARLFHKKIEL